MCNPATAITIAGFAVSAVGAIQQSRAASQQAEFEAATARNNAIRAQEFAVDARARGKQQIELLTQASRDVSRRRADAVTQLIGRQRVAQAALGQTVDTGSAGDLVVDTVATGKLDELAAQRDLEFNKKQIRRNAEVEAIGFMSQAGNFTSQAALADSRASAARTAGITNVIGTAITTAGTVHNRWQNRPTTRVPTASFSP